MRGIWPVKGWIPLEDAPPFFGTDRTAGLLRSVAPLSRWFRLRRWFARGVLRLLGIGADDL